MIEIKNLYYRYSQNKNILTNINLKIDRGELVCVMGANGSGKSTLARIINCLLKKASGSLIVDGLDSDIKKNLFEIRRKVGLVFQNPNNQFVTSIVHDEVAFGAENLSLCDNEIKKRVNDALEVTDMSEYKESMIEMLSGGQKQKISVADTLVMSPDYIIFDESTSMIDDKEELIKKIIDLNKIHKKTVIFITHDVEEAMNFDRLVLLDNGKIILDDKTENIINQEKILSESSLGIPFVVKMRNKILDYGFEIKKIMSLGELTKEILCSAKKKWTLD